MLVHGIELPTDGSAESNLDKRIITILNNNLGLTLSPEDLSAVHRLPRQSSASTTVSTSSSTRPVKPPPIIVQFTNKRSRNLVLTKRRELKGRGFSITEQLTARRASLLRKATDCVTNRKVSSAWSHDGKVLVKTLANRTVVISSNSDLDQFQ